MQNWPYVSDRVHKQEKLRYVLKDKDYVVGHVLLNSSVLWKVSLWSKKHKASIISQVFYFYFFQKKEKYRELWKGWSRSAAKPAPKYFCLSCTEIEMKAVQLDMHGVQWRTWFQWVTFEDNWAWAFPQNIWVWKIVKQSFSTSLFLQDHLPGYTYNYKHSH